MSRGDDEAGGSAAGSGERSSHEAASRPNVRIERIDLAPHRWYVERRGEGPPCLLLHGTGASGHSWDGLAARLAARHEVIVPDLPGHGRTRTPNDASLSLERTAADVAALLDALDVVPELVVGHSSGAAQVATLALDGRLPGARLAGIAPAMLLLDGVAGWLFPPLARLAAGLGWLPRLFAWRARDRRQVRRLLEGTGSRVDAESLAVYERLLADPVHVANVLRMMAEWNLAALDARLPSLERPVRLVAGANDRTVPLRVAYRTAARLPNATLEVLDGLGHLAHEEAPERVAAWLDEAPPPTGPTTVAARSRGTRGAAEAGSGPPADANRASSSTADEEHTRATRSPSPRPRAPVSAPDRAPVDTADDGASDAASPRPTGTRRRSA